MPLLVSIASLQQHETVRLSGELSAEAMAWGLNDPCVEALKPLRYELEVQLMGRDIFVEGEIEMPFDCRCVRCLEPFEHRLRLFPWSALLPLDGEDAAPVMDEGVDLTPQIREDTLLGLPQHPVCRPECRGLPSQVPDSTRPQGSSDVLRRVPSAWSALDSLKLD